MASGFCIVSTDTEQVWGPVGLALLDGMYLPHLMDTKVVCSLLRMTGSTVEKGNTLVCARVCVCVCARACVFSCMRVGGPCVISQEAFRCKLVGSGAGLSSCASSAQALSPAACLSDLGWSIIPSPQKASVKIG